MIEITNLTRIYKTEEIETTALNAINLNIKQGEFVAVMGASGCGKSTLLNILGMLDSPTTGEYLFDEYSVGSMKEKERANIRKSNIGFVFQNFNLIDELTVFENVELPLLYQKVSSAIRKQQVHIALEKMNITHRKNHYPQQLSGGQQQRCAVARAVVGNPKMILADEPTGNLDSLNGNEVMQLLSALNASGTTIVMVTHSRHDASFSHRIVHMLDGQILKDSFQTPTI
ncbi:MAG: ABC transporter ATP-binding protein [Bacteroidia bacterium]